jgi:hypothetical protein
MQPAMNAPARVQRLRVLIAALSLGAAGLGCPSLSTMQTVDTVPEGEVRVAVGAEAIGASSSGDNAVAPQVDIAVRYGLSERVDLGVKIYGAGIELGAKYQFLDGGFEAALAPAAAFSYFSSDDTSAGFLYLHLPFLMGAPLSDTLTFTFGPKLLYIFIFGDYAEEGDDDVTFSGDGLAAGAFVGLPIRVARNFWIAPEFNLYGNVTGDDSAFSTIMWQGGVGFYFGGGGDAPEDGPGGTED